MQRELSGDRSARAEDLVLRIQRGEPLLRDRLIRANWKYIVSTVSGMIGRPAEKTEEFSVALEAFNEAIDSYDMGQNAGFMSFANLVMRRRVIDFLRKDGLRETQCIPVAFDTGSDNGGLGARQEQPPAVIEKLELEEDILRFRKELESFNITLRDLVRCSPRHRDTRALCAGAAKTLTASEELAMKLKTTGRLPVTALAEQCGLSYKTLELHRRYIIALYLVLTSDMQMLKNYVELLEKGE